MYIADEFNIKDINIILEYIEQREFWTITTFFDDNIENSHLPFYVEKIWDKYLLFAHLSKKNNHLKIIEKGKSIISFLSDDTYVSHKIYNSEKSVPTWNYAALTIYGECSLLNEKETENIVIKLLEKHETKEHGINSNLIEKLSKYTLWIKFEVNNFECKFKFSQNKNIKEFNNMLLNLGNSKNNSDINAFNFIKKFVKK